MCIVKSDLEEQREARPGNKAWVATRTSEAEGEFHASLRVGEYLLSHVQHVVSADAPATCATPAHHIPRIGTGCKQGGPDKFGMEEMDGITVSAQKWHLKGYDESRLSVGIQCCTA